MFSRNKTLSTKLTLQLSSFFKVIAAKESISFLVGYQKVTQLAFRSLWARENP